MPSLTSARLGLPYLAAGQAQKELTHNEALALIDAGLHATAEASGLNMPPPSPEPGQCWIVGAAPMGVWGGQSDALACWTGSGWRFFQAVEGMQVWLRDQQLWAVRTADAWAIGEARAVRLLIGGNQVVGSRLPAIASPTGGSVIDAEARAALATIVERLAAHGLIEG